jgi:hypothetical protein
LAGPSYHGPPQPPPPCLLPTPDKPGVCFETITGQGTGQFTLFNDAHAPFGFIYMDNESITFPTPEPSSVLLFVAAGALLWGRIKSANGCHSR